MYEDKRLVIFLCMHRSGSSFVTRLMQRLGLALGPFELIGACESNKYGHFEAVPFHALDREIQTAALGFGEDIPGSPEVLQRFCDRQGEWDPQYAPPPAAVERGVELVRQLVESGPISGFKDPRAVLVWPFWQQVLAQFPGLQVIPVFLLRSPHEIAMSIFARAKRGVPYQAALDVTAVHLRRMLAIQQSWVGPAARVRFVEGAMADDLRQAAESCGLPWRDEILAETYDADCKHHAAAVVAHSAQALFEQLSGGAQPVASAANLALLERDAARRETLLQTALDRTLAENLTLTRHNRRFEEVLEQCGAEIKQFRHDNEQYIQAVAFRAEQVERLQEESAQYWQTLQDCQQELRQYRHDNQQHRETLAFRVRQTEELQRESRQYAQTLQACREELTRYTEENGKYAAMLAQLGDELAQYRHDNRQYVEELAFRTRQTEELQAESTQYYQTLQQCRQELERYAEENRSYAAMIAQLGAELEQYRHDNRQHLQAAAFHARQAEELRQEQQQSAEVLQQCRQDLHRYAEENGKYAAMIAQLDRELQEYRRDNAQLRHALEQHREQADGLTQRLHETQQHADRLTGELAAVRRSWLWRARAAVATCLGLSPG